MSLLITKQLKLASLLLLIFIVILSIYLVFYEHFDIEIIRGNNLEIIITDMKLQNYEPATIQSHDQLPKVKNATTTTNPSKPPKILIPSSWQQLNTQQFCSIHNSSNQQYLLQRIHQQQFTGDCNDPLTKFIIYDMSLQTTRGLGASLYGFLCRYMVVALQTNRTLLLHGKFDWTEGKTYCNHSNAMECYFLPLSHCDPIHILSQVNTSDPAQYHQGKNPLHCIFGDNDKYNNLSHCAERVIFINAKRTPKPLLQRPISWFAEQNFNMKIFELESIFIAFFLRPQPIIREIIYDKIAKSINKSLSTMDVNASEYISLPIRASDKCSNIKAITHKQYTHKAEIKCFTPVQYVLLMNVMRYYSSPETLLKGVIITSEDSSFVSEVVDIMKHSNVSNVSDWNIILNTEDYSVGEGTTTYKRTKLAYNSSLNYVSEIETSLYTDHIVSALSSLMLQLHLETEYLLWLYESSWTELMWNWLAILNCNINKEKHVPNYNKCVKLLFSGYIHRRNHNTVEFDKDIWQKIQNEGVDVEQFYHKFGIWYSNTSYCHIARSKNRIAK